MKNTIFVFVMKFDNLRYTRSVMWRYLIFSLLVIASLVCFSINDTNYGQIYDHFKDFQDASLVEMGDSYFKENSLDSALVCYSIVSGKYNNGLSKAAKHLCAYSFNRSGVIYLRYNSYAKGLNMFLKSLEVCEETGDEEYMPKIYNNVANVYYLFKDYETASSYCRKAYELGVKYGDEEIQNIVLKNLIGLDCYLRNYEKAQEHLKLFNNLKANDLHTFNYYLCISNGAIKLKQKRFEEALRDFRKSFYYADSCEMPKRLKYASLSNLSKTFLYMHRQDSAVYYLAQAEKIASDNQFLDLLADCYNDFADIYKQGNNDSRFLEYKKRYFDVSDSIFNMQEFGRIKDMQFVHEMEKIEKQIYQLNEMQALKDNQIKFQRLILFIVTGAFVIILLLSGGLYIQNKRLKEANNELFNKNIEILKADEEQKKKRQQTLKEHSEQETPPKPVEKVKYQGSFIGEAEKQQLKEAIQNVMDNTLEYCSVEFNLDKMASLVNSRTKYVSQVINECYGKNFNAFINEYRIKEACRKLIDIENYGGYTIAAIAESVGFKSNANFNLIFKKVTGITPSMYQDIAKKRQNNPQEQADL